MAWVERQLSKEKGLWGPRIRHACFFPQQAFQSFVSVLSPHLHVALLCLRRRTGHLKRLTWITKAFSTLTQQTSASTHPFPSSFLSPWKRYSSSKPCHLWCITVQCWAWESNGLEVNPASTISQPCDIIFLCLTHLICPTQTKMVVTTQRVYLKIKWKSGCKTINVLWWPTTSLSLNPEASSYLPWPVQYLTWLTFLFFDILSFLGFHFTAFLWFSFYTSNHRFSASIMNFSSFDCHLNIKALPSTLFSHFSTYYSFMISPTAMSLGNPWGWAYRHLYF